MNKCGFNVINKNSQIFALYDFNKYDFKHDKDSNGTVAIAGGDRLFLDPLYIKRVIRGLLKELYGKDCYFSRENYDNGKLQNNTQGLIDKYIDIRLFGVGSKASKSIPPIKGATNFGYGNSLNLLRFLDRTTIERGLVGFGGAIAAANAKHSGMRDSDFEYLDQCIVKSSCNSLAGSRSMRLYIRVELKDCNTYMPDLVSMVKFQESDGLVGEMTTNNVLDITELVNCLNSFDEIETIHFFWDEILPLKYENEIVETTEELNKLFNSGVLRIAGCEV